MSRKHALIENNGGRHLSARSGFVQRHVRQRCAGPRRGAASWRPDRVRPQPLPARGLRACRCAGEVDRGNALPVTRRRSRRPCRRLTCRSRDRPSLRPVPVEDIRIQPQRDLVADRRRRTDRRRHRAAAAVRILITRTCSFDGSAQESRRCAQGRARLDATARETPSARDRSRDRSAVRARQSSVRISRATDSAAPPAGRSDRPRVCSRAQLRPRRRIMPLVEVMASGSSNSQARKPTVM